MPFIFAFCVIVLLLVFIALMSRMDKRAALKYDAVLVALRTENAQLKQSNAQLKQQNDQLQQRLASHENTADPAPAPADTGNSN